MYDYDAQIKRLTADPTLIKADWDNSEGLFGFATPTRSIVKNPAGQCTGCLTMIRNKPNRHAWTPELTDEIRADDRLPKGRDDLRPEHLPAMKEWQQRLDREIRPQGLGRFLPLSLRKAVLQSS